MALHYSGEILKFKPKGPYHLIGYSSGGWIAYAVAQHLNQTGEKVNLCMLDSGMTCKVPFWMHIPLRSLILIGRIPIHFRRLSKLPINQYFAYILNKIGWLKVHLFRKLEDKETLQKRTIETDTSEKLEYFASIVQNYAPDKYSGDLTLFSVKRIRWFHRLSWKYYIKGKFDVRPVDGGSHHDVIKPEYVGELSTNLKKSLEELEEDLTISGNG